MSRSILLQITRDSIEEVFQAKYKIDKEALLHEHPLLNEPVAISINIYINEELQGSYTRAQSTNNSLLRNIIIGAKKAAFEDRETLTTSQYLHAKIELILHTQNGDMSEIDPAILKDNSDKNVAIY